MPTSVKAWVAAALAAALAFVFYFRPIQDDDAWLHFAAGRWMIENGAVPRVDSFSCTAPGVPYVDHEWLAQIIFESSRRAGGLLAFRILVASCAAASFGLFGYLTIRAGAGGRAAVVAALGSLLLQWHVARARPQVFTLLCVALLFFEFICKDQKLTKTRAAFFAAICIFWANTHAACVIAPGFLAFAAAGAWIHGLRAHGRRLGLLTIAAAVLLLVNPYTYQVYSYAFETQGLADLIPEWKPISTLIFDPAEQARQTGGNDFRSQYLYNCAVLFTTFGAAVYGFLAFRESPDVYKSDPAAVAASSLAPAAVLCAAMPFIANRHDLFMSVPFAFCSISLRRAARSGAAGRIVASGVAWVAAVLAVVGLARDADYRYRHYLQIDGGPLADTWPPHEPTAAVDFIEKAGLRGRCLNRPSWGGYLLYRLYPNITVSFDGRITTLGAGVYRDHVDFFNGKRNREIADHYQFDFAVVMPFVFGYSKPLDNPNYIAADLSDWAEVYRDPHPEREGSAVVALRISSPLYEENLARVLALKR